MLLESIVANTLSLRTSWNHNLTSKRGLGMGGEFRRKGVNVMLGPAVGPVGRIVSGGRNWEGRNFSPVSMELMILTLHSLFR
jgi:hypothetical protein